MFWKFLNYITEHSYVFGQIYTGEAIIGIKSVNEECIGLYGSVHTDLNILINRALYRQTIFITATLNNITPINLNKGIYVQHLFVMTKTSIAKIRLCFRFLRNKATSNK